MAFEEELNLSSEEMQAAIAEYHAMEGFEEAIEETMVSSFHHLWAGHKLRSDLSRGTQVPYDQVMCLTELIRASMLMKEARRIMTPEQYRDYYIRTAALFSGMVESTIVPILTSRPEVAEAIANGDLETMKEYMEEGKDE